MTSAESKGGRAGDDGVELVVEGVSLAQYAAVVAALDEELELDEVLDVEGLDSGEWRAAEAGFRLLLCRDEEALEDYREELAEAQDRLGRRVIPLDENLDAWASFLALSATEGAAELVEKHGLRLSDLARLERLWSWKLGDNTILERRAERLVERLAREPPRLPPIHVGPTLLKPSPAARPRAAPRQRAAAAIPPSDRELRLTLDDYALLVCELERQPGARTALFARRGLGLETGEHVDRAWAGLLRRDAELRADFRARRAHHAARLGLAAASAALTTSGASAPASRPFVAEAVPAAPGPSQSPGSTGAPASLLDRTAPPSGAPRGPLLPFRAGAAAAPQPDGPPVARRPAPPRPGGAPPGSADRHLDSTAPPLPTAPESGLPFRRPAALRGPGAELDSTAPPPSGLATPALPFRPSTPGALLIIPLREIAVESARARGGSLDETSSQVSSLVDLPALPFRRIGGPRRSRRPLLRALPTRSGDSPASVPFQPLPFRATRESPTPIVDLDSTCTDLVVPILSAAAAPATKTAAPVDLSVAQFASLCAELAAYPAQSAAVLARYQVADADTKRRLDAYWYERLGREHEARREFDRVLAQYGAWLRQKR